MFEKLIGKKKEEEKKEEKEEIGEEEKKEEKQEAKEEAVKEEEKKEEATKEEKVEKVEEKEVKPEEKKEVGLGIEEKVLKLEEEIKDIMVQINALKELNKQINERITASSEKIGELRGLFFERETTIKDALISIKKTNEIIAELEPNRIIEDRKKTLTELNVVRSKLLEYESIIKDLLKKFTETKEMFERLKNMSALLDISKEVGDKMLKIDEIRKEIERYSHKVESMYVEMNRRFEEFPIMVDKVRKLDGR